MVLTMKQIGDSRAKLTLDKTNLRWEARISRIKHLRAILTILKVSQSPCKLAEKSHFSINEVGNLQDGTFILGCQVGSLPTKYLGRLTGAKTRIRGVEWGVGRCENKLSRWKSQYLSLGAY
ncbi:hypothetical protein H5410_023273 [Solanum commersonii]|uniref:Uncharacterized protein n=1 Tax=Solanum commersonii TaxID=4109 RepID=A0A9J5ZJ17_SOLCO|nr:hypothetical protein H5410_023273 [Solanum commersonii]